MKIFIFIALSAATALLVGCNGSDETSANSSDASSETIVDIAVDNPDFSTLVTALQAADLVETLNGEGPFTVFAPTNAAFAQLPAGTVEELLQPRNKERLTQVLTYHVLAGEVVAADVSAGSVEMVSGDDAEIVVRGGTVSIDGATVVQTDIMASNGVIHVIDAVMLP